MILVSAIFFSGMATSDACLLISVGFCMTSKLGTSIELMVIFSSLLSAVATLYLAPEAVKLTQTPGLNEGDEVMTVYGKGYIESKRVKQGDYVVKLRNWALAQGQSPTCHLQAASCVKIHHLKVGSIAKTVYGLVRVLKIKRDGQHECEAVHWIMADGKPPKFYLAPEAFALMSLKP